MNERPSEESTLERCLRCHGPLDGDTRGGICGVCLATVAQTVDLNRSPSDSDTTLWQPTKSAERYERLELLGRGGMGEVYRARQTDLDRIVALKLVLNERLGDPMFLARFRREALAMARLNHPHIVGVYDFGEWQGRAFLAMEFVAGTSLRTRLRQAALPPDEAFAWGEQLCDAIGYAHELGIIHRDLKPENILVTSEGHLKVADFGLAKLVGRLEQVELTAEGAVLGTLRYMAPEQLAGSKDVDERADVYSLGVVLYEMFTGCLPMGRFAPPSRLVNVVRQLDAVLLTALDADSARRFANARELGSALAAARRGESFALSPSMAAGLDAALTGNLPQTIAPMVGREDERQWLRARLLTQRLVTLTGAGGTGKSRLALQAGFDVGHSFRDGAWFVPLAELSDSRRLPSVIATTLGIREDARDIGEVLCQYLANRELLLILDNFEQIIAGAPFVAKCLQAAPNLRIIVTSRVALRVGDECELSVGPLGLPRENASLVSLAAGAAAPAVKLFVERAQAARPDFQLSEQNLPAVLAICRKLDGLPLAIELAAARVRLLTPESIAARLSSSLKLLTGGARDLPVRQQTMRAAIAWSYQMLTPQQRTLLAWLSLLRGSFTVESVERYVRHLAARDDVPCPADGEPLEEFDVLDAFTTLVEHNLLRQSSSIPTPRFSLYETIREFGDEQLRAVGELAAIRHSHAQWCLDTVTRGEPLLTGSSPEQVLAEWDGELPDFREALAWWRGTGDRPDEAVRIIGELWYYWVLRGTANEGIEETSATVQHPSATRDTPPFSRALHALGTLCYLRDRPKEARTALEQALEIRRRFEGEDKVYGTLANLASLKRSTGDLAGALGDFQEVLAFRRRQGDKRTIAITLSNLSLVQQFMGQMHAARVAASEALDIYRELRDRRGESRQQLNLGRIEHSLGNYPEALAAFNATGDICEEIGDQGGMVNARLAVANCLSALQRYEEANRAFAECEAFMTPEEAPSRRATFHIARGYLRAQTGDWTNALEDYRLALQMRMAHDDLYGLGEVLVQIAEVYAQQHRPVEAARLLGAESLLRERSRYEHTDATLAEIERSRRLILEELSAEALRVAEEEGRQMSLEQLAQQMSSP
jgi:predicted ATPase/tRNA A-37 threonylcarbamoyl transferase component Bud32